MSLIEGLPIAQLLSKKELPFKTRRNCIAFKAACHSERNEWNEESLKIKLRFFVRQNDRLQIILFR
ncbi:hypothetical protein [Chryseobacterium sp. JAH]|uniref:hypothetical protein n=1 Tax=Chryseobacterium sp. JAH TaxID=1742858 RepID=UPI000647FFA0|nr:hypothetical protein [Chryseobacterium sp. JAH]KUJ50332.1 hypothetical protein AR685_15415 [Chryseobacterium sp. JAH]